jgi:hypothetical protein
MIVIPVSFYIYSRKIERPILTREKRRIKRS